ncbi:MAG: AEC family transporter, partial [Eubacteriales bacterium]|nr:AEC family transporter [Eubacteriales bacterium]
MHPALHIFLYNIVPLFLLILAGLILGRKFKMDVGTLSNIIFYVTMPSFALVQLYNTDFGNDQL